MKVMVIAEGVRRGPECAGAGRVTGSVMPQAGADSCMGAVKARLAAAFAA